MGELLLFKCPYYQIYRFNQILIIIPMAFSTEIEKNPKIHMKSQNTFNSHSNLEKKDKTRGITLPDFKTYYKTTVIKGHVGDSIA